jgi:hypothetical protein
MTLDTFNLDQYWTNVNIDWNGDTQEEDASFDKFE